MEIFGNKVDEVEVTKTKRWVVVALVAMGALCGILGAILIPVMENGIRQSVKDVIVISTKEEYDDQYTDIESDYVVHIWNATNLKRALDFGEKIHFEQLSYEMTYVEENFDFDWHHNRETLEYKSWWTYLPKDNSAERMATDQIVQVNGVYMASVADFGNSEQALFFGLSYLAVQSVSDLLDVYIANVQATLLPAYLSTAPSFDLVALHWAGLGPPVLGFECSTTDGDLDSAVNAWDPLSPTSVVNQTTYNIVWKDLVFDEGDSSQKDSILSCLLQIKDSNSYAEWILGGNSTTLLNGTDLVKGAQFGSGAVTLGTLGSPTVAAQPGSFDAGYVVAMELFSSYDIELDAVAALNFLTVFSNAEENVRFATTLFLSDLPLLEAVEIVVNDPTFASTGLTRGNWVTYATYLYTYLPETYFLKGLIIGYLRRDPSTLATDPRGLTSLDLLDDGTGQFNSGLFTRRSPNEILFGYHDRIFDLVPQELASIPFTFSGTLGVQYDSPEAQRDANVPLIYEVKTGKGRIHKAGEYVMWRNVSKGLTTRDSFPRKDGSTFKCSSWEQQGYESCNIWLDKFTMNDMPINQLGPFKEGNIEQNIKFWSTEVMRAVPFEYDKDVTVRGIKGRKYKVKEEEIAFTANCTLEPTRCNPENEFYRVWGPSYILPMATTAGGTKLSVAYPAYGKVDEFYRQQTTGLPPYDSSRMGTFVVVEPLTGFFIHGHLRLQYCYDLDVRQLTSSIWENLFAPNPNVLNVLYWPLLWFDDTDIIERKTARRFRRNVYLNRTLALSFTIILLVIAVGCFIAAAVVHRRSRQTPVIAQPTLDDDDKDPDDDDGGINLQQDAKHENDFL